MTGIQGVNPASKTGPMVMTDDQATGAIEDVERAGVADMFFARAVLCAIILVAAALRLYNLDSKSLWGDEILSAMAVTDFSLTDIVYTTVPPLRPIIESLTDPVVIPNMGPHFTMLGLTKLFTYIGAQDYIIRLSSAFVGILGVAAIFILGTALFSTRVGLFSAALLALSPFHLYHSQEVRFYASMALLSVLSLYFLYQALEQDRWIYWGGLILTVTLNTYNHLFAILTWPAMTLYALIILALRMWRPAPLCNHKSDAQQPVIDTEHVGQVTEASGNRGRLATLRRPIFAFLGICLLILPMLAPILVTLFTNQNRTALSIGEFDTEELGQSVRVFSMSPAYFSRLFGLFGIGQGGYLVIYAVLFLLGTSAGLYRQRWRTVFLIILWIVMPFALMTVVKSSKGIADRYLIFVLPIYVIGVASGANELVSIGERYLTRLTIGNRRWFSYGMVILILAAMSIPAVRSAQAAVKATDFRSVCQFVIHNVRPEDKMVLVHRLPWPEEFGYYCGQLPAYRKYRLPKGKEGIANLQRLLDQSGRVWLFGSTRGMEPAIMAWLGEHTTLVPFLGAFAGVAEDGARLSSWEARELLVNASRLASPPYAPLVRVTAEALIDNGQAEKADALFAAKLRESPYPADLHRSYASALLARGRLPEAFAHYRAAHQLAPWLTSAFPTWAIASNADSIAEADARADVNAALNEGKRLAQAKQYAKAMRLLQSSIVATPNSGPLNLALGMLLLDWSQQIKGDRSQTLLERANKHLARSERFLPLTIDAMAATGSYEEGLTEALEYARSLYGAKMQFARLTGDSSLEEKYRTLLDSVAKASDTQSPETLPTTQ